MSSFLCFIIGLLLGGCITLVVLCCLQINRINEFEAEIRKLRAQLPKELRTEVR